MTAAGALTAAAESLRLPVQTASLKMPAVQQTPPAACAGDSGLADDTHSVIDRGRERARIVAFCATGSFRRPLYASLVEAGLPPSVREDVIEAFGATLNLVLDVADGDGFHVRYEQAMSGERAVGPGRLLWAEVQSKAKGTIAIHRFRSNDGSERYWTASGKAAVPPVMRLPLVSVNVSSGFGMRPDPFDRPTSKFLGISGPLHPDHALATQPEAIDATKDEPKKDKPKKRRPSSLSFSGFSSSSGDFANGERGRETVVETPAAEPSTPRVDVKAVDKPAELQRRLFMHAGVDLVAPTGTPIFAAGDGVVVGAGPNGPYGNWIRIDHPGRVTTIYGHLSAFGPDIKPGTEVKEGQLIGLVGNTGRSTGAHLHFEVWRNGQPVDPMATQELRLPVLNWNELQRLKARVGRSLGRRGQELADRSLNQ
jgi:murein DD-endopeptidase MepM/ murein hydrolase activator NlpD